MTADQATKAVRDALQKAIARDYPDLADKVEIIGIGPITDKKGQINDRVRRCNEH